VNETYEQKSQDIYMRFP